MKRQLCAVLLSLSLSGCAVFVRKTYQEPFSPSLRRIALETLTDAAREKAKSLPIYLVDFRFLGGCRMVYSLGGLVGLLGFGRAEKGIYVASNYNRAVCDTQVKDILHEYMHYFTNIGWIDKEHFEEAYEALDPNHPLKKAVEERMARLLAQGGPILLQTHERISNVIEFAYWGQEIPKELLEVYSKVVKKEKFLK